MIDNKTQKELRQKYNPDGSELREHQLELLKILDFFDSFCKDHKINYWLSSGTCLGAVRHGGFIPWDDDVDVEMLREDYLKFKDLFSENENFVLQTYENDLFYTEPFSKLRYKKSSVSEGKFDEKYKYRGLFLDIFIIEPIPLIPELFCHFSFGAMRHFSFHINDNKGWVKVFILWKKFNFKLVQFCRWLFGNYKSSVLRHTYGAGSNGLIRKKEEIFPLCQIQFEGKYYFCPGNSHKYLQRLFGDYMKLPKKIHSHNLIHNQKN